MEVEDKVRMNSIQLKLIRVGLMISQELDYLLTLLLWDLQMELKLKKVKKVSNLIKELINGLSFLSLSLISLVI